MLKKLLVAIVASVAVAMIAAPPAAAKSQVEMEKYSTPLAFSAGEPAMPELVLEQKVALPVADKSAGKKKNSDKDGAALDAPAERAQLPRYPLLL